MIFWGGQHRVLGFLLALAYFLGQPPVHWPWAGWVACALFAWMVCRFPTCSRRDWIWLWVASSLVWLGLLQGIRLAFWPLTFGWIALSLYLAIYWPLARALAVALHHRWNLPLSWSCAMGWTSCELIRAYAFTGFAGCSLVHSQTPWPALLPLASHFGGYGVGFMMMFTVGWLVEPWAKISNPSTDAPAPRATWLNGLVARLSVALIAAWLVTSIAGYRSRQTWLEGMQPIKPLGRFLLIQDHMPTLFDATPELIQEGWLQYELTTRRAARAIENASSVDVVIWPESVFAGGAPYLDWDGDRTPPSDLGIDERNFGTMTQRLSEHHANKLQRLSGAFPKGVPNLLLGTDVFRIRDRQFSRFNAALWQARDGSRPEYYAKHHLVMFGEYIPIVSWIPGLMSMLGMGELSAGTEPKAWEFAPGRRIAPSICFEDVVPQLTQSHVHALNARRQFPDVLVNVSNDAWFRGSSILDHHLNSAIVTAVENRTPMLVAANTGITAWIDGDGHVVKRLPKMEAGWLLAEPIPDGRIGGWVLWGDGPARGLAAITVALWSWLVFLQRIRRQGGDSANPDTGPRASPMK